MKLFLTAMVTFLITGPIGIVVGYKMAERQKYELGVYRGKTETLEQLYQDVESHLGYSIKLLPGDSGNSQSDSDNRLNRQLYQLTGRGIYLIEVNGVKTFATSD